MSRGQPVVTPSVRHGLTLAGAVVLLDQVSKWAVLSMFRESPESFEVLPFFNLVLVWNRGVSFGMFGGGMVPAWALSLVAVAIVAVMLFWLRRSDQTWTVVALGLVIGGAVGNIIDRLYHGAVVDFLDFHAAGWHWPAFNVADSGISIGVVMLLLETLFMRREPAK
jgi:signal peptidase II